MNLNQLKVFYLVAGREIRSGRLAALRLSDARMTRGFHMVYH